MFLLVIKPAVMVSFGMCGCKTGYMKFVPLLRYDERYLTRIISGYVKKQIYFSKFEANWATFAEQPHARVSQTKKQIEIEQATGSQYHRPWDR